MIMISSSSSRPPPLLLLDTGEGGGGGGGEGRSKTTTKMTTKASDSCISSDDDNDDDGIDTTIIIRRYVEETDRDQVHNLFRRGMESLLPTLTYNVITSSLFYVPVGCISLLVRWCCCCCVSSKSKFINISNDNSKKFISSMSMISRGSSSSSFLLLELLASFGVVILSSILLVHYTGFVLFNPYIQHSIDTDLSNIYDVYFKNGGTFLVAVETTTSTSSSSTTSSLNNRIVGCVAGEKKKKTQKKQQQQQPQEEDDQRRRQQQGQDEDDDDDGVYELRRMSVDSTIQRRGLGKKLIQALEKELKNVVVVGSKGGCQMKKMKKIYLTCSNLQHSAHHLYRKSGFVHVDTTFSKNSNAPYLFRNIVRFYRLEKYYYNCNKR